MKITNQNDAEIIERLERVEEKIDKALKRIDSLNEKLSRHIAVSYTHLTLPTILHV